jgi:hypothetical protein
MPSNKSHLQVALLMAQSIQCASGGFPQPLPGGRFYGPSLPPILFIFSRAPCLYHIYVTCPRIVYSGTRRAGSTLYAYGNTPFNILIPTASIIYTLHFWGRLSIHGFYTRAYEYKTRGARKHVQANDQQGKPSAV